MHSELLIELHIELIRLYEMGKSRPDNTVRDWEIVPPSVQLT